MVDRRSEGVFAALRAAARVTEERFLIGIADMGERKRIAGALAAEGTVIEAESLAEGLSRLAEEPFEMVVLAPPGEVDHAVTLSAVRESRPLADVVLAIEGDPAHASDLFARDAAAVLPRPFPASDALLRAHVRWLASCRRARTRGLLLANALVRHREELMVIEPALAQALSGIVAESVHEPAVLVVGDVDLVKQAGGRPVESSPDVVVVAVAASEDLGRRMQEARARSPGAALVVVDAAPDRPRLSSALYGGARAYVARGMTDFGRVIAAVAARRRGEVAGRRLVEALARFGVLDERERRGPAPQRDVDARLIADATGGATGTIVPSGHEVLVVDDEVVVLTVLREALRRGGYKVTTAASAEEAIELMRRRVFDLVLTDKNLPGASGLDVLRAARSLDPPPAVVLITGYSSYDSAVQALDIGAHDYIEKPIRDVENLRFRIRRALSRRDEQLARARQSPGQGQGHGKDGKGRVLVVEVEKTRRQLVAEFLGRDYDVTTAANGDEALALLERERYDVVLADRNLPGLSGAQVIEQARKLLPHCAAVLFTEYPSYDTVKEAFELGVDAYLVRPSEDLRLLANKVEGALRSRGGILLG